MPVSIEFHAIQTVPPANINRDEDGSPKTATYGGTRRARVSSQAWKRAMRADFQGRLDESELGVRSLRLVDQLADRIGALAPDSAENASEWATAGLKAAGIGVTKVPARKAKDGTESEEYLRTGALLFLSNPQLDELAAITIAAEGNPSKVDAKAVLKRGNSIDLALFGRMVADSPDLNVDAAAQVAHALGVHTVVSEFDYFTAVDDKAPEDNAGAGMIGVVEFNSSTLYRYATVNLDALAANLGDGEAAARAVEAFAHSFVASMPTGKQNTFANRSVPEFVLVTIRADQPINFAAAFEEALDQPGNRAKAAVARLAEYSRSVDDAYGSSALASFVVSVGDADFGPSAERLPLPDVIARVGEVVRDRFATSVS